MSVSETGSAADVPRAAPGSTAALRAANQRRVLGVLLRAGTATQAEIARETGLATGTVSSIVRELAAAEILSTVAGSGRRGTTVQLAKGAGLVGAVDFGHSHVAVALGDMGGQVLGELTHPLACCLRGRRGHGSGSRAARAAPRGDPGVALRRTHPGHGPPLPDRRRRRHVLGDHARVGRSERARGGRVQARDQGPGRQRREPRGTGRAPPGCGPGPRQRGVRQGLLRCRRRPDPRPPALPRHRRHRGRDRPPDLRRAGPAVPVRQSRLPRGVRRHRARARHDGRPDAAARRGPSDPPMVAPPSTR